MSVLTSVLMYIFALLGIGAGMILAYLAPEEIEGGKKFFIWLRRILVVIAAGVVMYYAWIASKFMFGGVFAIVTFVYLSLDWKRGGEWFSLLLYVIFAIAYFMLPMSQLLLASTLFLYGLPTGTLWRKMKHLLY